jgi:O-acetylserine/cysteine efflux transporter
MATAAAAAGHDSKGLDFAGFCITQLVNVLFALNVIASKVIVTATAPFLAVTLRMGLVFLICSPAFRLVPGRNRTLAFYGLLNGGLFLLLMNLALSMASNVAALAIAGQLSVPFSLLLGALLLGERLSRRKMLGVVLAFAGVVVLVFDRHVVDDALAVLVMCSAALAWGGGTLLQRKLGGIPVLTIQAWNGLMGGALLLPFTLLLEPGKTATLAHVGWVPAAWFAFSVLGSTVLGQGAMAWLLQRYPISTVMPLTLASPVISTACAALYFGTPVTPVMILGGLLALIGVTVIATAKDARTPPIEVP